MSAWRGLIIFRAALTLLLAGFAYLAFRAAVIALFSPQAAAIVAAFPPPDPASRVTQALTAGHLSPAQVGEVSSAVLRWAPLAEEPLILAADAARRRGENARALGLAEAAVRRRSRFTPYRVFLLELNAAEGRWEETLEQASAIIRLRPDTAPQVGFILLGLSENADASATMVRMLGDPSRARAARWAGPLQRAARRRPIDEALRAALTRNRERR